MIPSSVNLPSAQHRWLPSGSMPPLCNPLSLSVSASATEPEAISPMSPSSISHGGGGPAILSMSSYGRVLVAQSASGESIRRMALQIRSGLLSG